MLSLSPPPPGQAQVVVSPEDELARMMRQVTPMPDDDLEDGPVDEDGQQSFTSPSTSFSFSEASDGLQVPQLSGPIRSNEQRVARRLADRLNLFPYQKDAVKELVNVYIQFFLCDLLLMKFHSPLLLAKM